jgi:predicted ABC-type ATPase
MPHLYILAGPNGAGKTTAAMTLLPKYLHVREFVNADEIARGLSPFNAEGVALQAGRAMLTRMQELLEKGEDFTFETTLASRSFAPFLRKAKQAGYKIHLFFFWLNNPEAARRRVAERVKRGGHHIPDDVVERRYFRGIQNLKQLYAPLADYWAIYDNMELHPRLITQMTNGTTFVYDGNLWKIIQAI